MKNKASAAGPAARKPIIRTFRRRWAVACVALALSAASYGQFTWIGTASGNWSATGNWQGGTPPPAGGGTGVTLTFNNLGNFVWTATNDLGNPFTANGFTLNSFSSGTTTIASAASNSIAFGGSNAFVTNTGTGNFTISSAATLNSNLTLGGTGVGNTTFSGIISGSNGIIMGGPQASNPVTNLYILSGANTFNGGVTLNSGSLLAGNATALGTGGVTVNGGTFGASATVTMANNFALNSTFNVRSQSSFTLTGIISGANGLDVRGIGTGAMTLTLQNANTYSGSTVLDIGSIYNANSPFNGASMTLSSTTGGASNGSILNSSNIAVRAGGTLTLDNTNAVVQRIGSAANVTLAASNLTLTGNASTATNQLMGNLNGEGYNTVTVTAGTAGSQLSAAAVNRLNRGTFFFRGTGLGNAAGAGVSNITFTAAPGLVGGGGAAGSTNMSILNWAVGSNSATGTASDLVTYDVNGIRPLTAAEYATSLSSGATNNVKLTGIVNNDNTETVNALVTSANVTGTGTINIGSGTWLNTATATMSNNLNFGTAEANIFAVGTTTVNGIISGSNGLTKSGGGTLTLGNVGNTYSGTTTVNAGLIAFANTSAFGSSNAFVIGSAGSTNRAGLSYTGTTSANLTQNMAVNSGYVNLAATGAAGQLTVSGTISGNGGVHVTGGTGSAVILTGNNTYKGGTRVFTGDVAFSSDANLGDVSGGFDLGSGATSGIKLLGTWNTNRSLNVSFGSQFNSNGFDATLNGVVSGTSALSKVGAGSLTLNANNTYSGAVTIGSATNNGGNLIVNGATVAPVTITNGNLMGTGRVGVLTLNNLGLISPGNSAGVLNGTSLTWNPGGQMNFELGTSSDRLDLASTFTKGTATGGTGFLFNFSDSGGLAPATYTLINFSTFAGGFTAGDFSYTGPVTGFFTLNATNLQFTVQAVPEPASIAIVGLGALAMLRRRRAAKK